MTQENANEPVLCYIEGNKAYFTTCPLDQQWGDDWDDAPYEYNAEQPYEWHPDMNVPRYEITALYFESYGYITPDGYTTNSPFSVRAINRGDVAWLRYGGGYSDYPPIHAGTPLSEFKRLIKAAGGTIYVLEAE